MAYLSFFVLAFVLVFVSGVHISPDQQDSAESGIAISDKLIKEIFDFPQNLLSNYKVDQLQDARAKDSKSEVQDVSPIKEYLHHLLQNFKVDVASLKAKFLVASVAPSKREVREEPVDPLVAIIDGILGAIASTLKSLVDSFLITFNNLTSGVFRDVLIAIQTLAFDIIDTRFPSSSISYTSNLRL